jgi:Holliday junction resolvase RusA-like endonuclease
VVRIIGAREYRFVVPGSAVSFRSRNARAYKRKVRRAAAGSLPRTPVATPVELRLDYFHPLPRKCDMDNVAKCVLDALNGVAYIDDQLATLQSARAHDLRKRVQIADGPVDLVKPLRDHAEYLFVRIRLAD